MKLDLEDRRIRMTIKPLSDGRHRLTLDYPAEPVYRDKVLKALSDFLRPSDTKEELNHGG